MSGCTVWSAWSGPMWPHIQLCLDTAKHYVHDFHLVRDEEVDELIGKDLLHPKWRDVPQIGPRFCLLRAALLYLHGGFYSDADTIWLKEPTLDCDHELWFCKWPRYPTRILSGYVGARKGSGIIKKWIDNCNWLIEHEWSDERDWWLVFGEKALTPVAVANQYRGCVQFPLTTFVPLDLDKDSALFQETYAVEDFLKPETVAFALSHSFLVNHYRWGLLMGADEMAASPILIHRLFTAARKGLAV